MDHLAASNIGDPIVRGQLRRIRLEEWVTQNGRMPIMIDEQSGVLVGGHGSHLDGECDMILHAFAPLGYKSWKQIPLQDRETLIEQLKDNFILDTTRPSVKRFLNYRMSKGYANFKHKMLMHFRNYATIEETRDNPFGNISPKNWSSLCDLFAVESIENIKVINAAFVMRILRPQGDSFASSRDGKGFKGICCKFYGTTETSHT
ncbi:hypothetical protein MKW98_021288 [Papaver atlanticum]|uniref:Uncharacterized protein n=1 Tax=Papaver atlanticum TaxID=357466 RepID=A0AAD4XHH3_9MAGN|nr:hypothetical protein MKW98_021288 [Papaver atlanticum]